MADITWKTTALPDAILGVPYQAGLGFTGNATAVTAGSATAGSLPTGLVVNASDHVRVTGTPTAIGTFTFTLSLTDTAGAVASSSMSIRVRDVVHSDVFTLSAADKVAGDIAKLRWP
jgi:Putative Ig domain